MREGYIIGGPNINIFGEKGCIFWQRGVGPGRVYTEREGQIIEGSKI